MSELHTKTSSEKFQFLSGGGEMGRLMRLFDWSQTAAGTPGTWPQSLRTTLNILLHSKFPMFLWWGPELICFYNDAYRPSLGENGKHPTILGRPAKEAWTEIWHIIKPLIDQVLAGGEATWSEDQLIPIYRNGKIEDVYWTFSYSPVTDESGSVSGVLVICSETTEKVKMVDQLKTSKNELEFAIQAAKLGTFDYDPVTNKFSANSRLKKWFGLPDDQQIELHHAINAIAEKDRPRVLAAIQKALGFESGGSYDIVYTIIHPIAETETIVHAKGIAWFNESKVAYRFNGTLEDVTEQTIALHQREESEARFRNIANNAPVLIWMVDADKQCYFLNTAWLNFTGRTPEQEYGIGWLDGVHADDIQRCLKIYAAAFDKREEFYMEYRLKRHDGEYRWLSDNGVPRFSTEGIFEGYIGACMDIHERIIYQKKLKEDEERLNIIIEATELATWELNLQDNTFNYSPRLLEIFGNISTLDNHSEILKQVHPEDLQIRAAAFNEAYATGALHYISRIIWEDKSIHWVENKGKIFYDEANEPLKLIGTSRDITEEKSYQQQLEEREQKFRLLADSMPQFVWTGDAEGNLNYFSKSVYDYSGLTAEQIDKDGWLQIVHPDEKEGNVKAWINSVTTGKDFIFEHRFGRHDGEYRWQLSRAIPQKDASGNIRMWVGTSTDIQEMKELDQQKDFFISMASHELKTPITSIKGYVQMLQSMYGKTEDGFLKSSLQVIDKQISTLTNLISDLLDLSKIKSGSLALNRENFQMNELAEEVINEIKHINPGYNISFSKHGETLVNADRRRIGQVLINFLTNAVKYSPESKIISVKVITQDNNVQVSVEDSGIGINKTDQEKIFERFYRVEGKNEKTFPGFGIGLFIASEIIHRHNGKINVKSEPGKGSIFYFSIPFVNQLK